MSGASLRQSSKSIQRITDPQAFPGAAVAEVHDQSWREAPLPTYFTAKNRRS